MHHFKNIAKHSTVFGATELIKKGIGFIMIPVYTRFLMPADYGLLELLDLTLTVLAIIFGVRIGAGVIRFYHQYESEFDKNEVFSTALITMITLSLICLLGLYVFSGPITGFIAGDTEQIKAFQLVFICLALQNIYLTGESFLLAQKKSVIYSSLSLVNLVLNLSFNILFLIVFRMGVFGLILSMVIVKSVNLICVLFITTRKLPLRFSWPKLKLMINYTLPLIPAGAAMFLLHFSDRFFVRKYCAPDDLGLYSLGYKFGMILSMLVASPIFKIWNTMRYEIAKQPNAPTVFAQTFTWFTLILVTAGLGISLFIDEVIFFMATETYQGASLIVPLITLAYIMFGMSGFLNLGNMITGRTSQIMIIQIFVALLNIVFNIILISRYGIYGAAISTLLSFSTLAVLMLIASQQVLYVPFEYRRIVILFCTGGVIFGIARLVEGPILLVLTEKIGLMIAYLLVLLMIGFFPKDELQSGKSLFHSLMRRFPFGKIS